MGLSCVFQVEECHLPGLGVALTLDYKPDTADEAVSPLVSYVSGLLLGTNSKVRTWFSMFIRNGQQVRSQGSNCLWIKPWIVSSGFSFTVLKYL